MSSLDTSLLIEETKLVLYWIKYRVIPLVLALLHRYCPLTLENTLAHCFDYCCCSCFYFCVYFCYWKLYFFYGCKFLCRKKVDLNLNLNFRSSCLRKTTRFMLQTLYSLQKITRSSFWNLLAAHSRSCSFIEITRYLFENSLVIHCRNSEKSGICF